jgi:hypothetical protein
MLHDPKQCTHPAESVEKQRPLPVDDCWKRDAYYVEYDCKLCGSTQTRVERSNGDVLSSSRWWPPHPCEHEYR